MGLLSVEITSKRCIGQGMDQQLHFIKNVNKFQLIIEKRPNLEKFKESLQNKETKTNEGVQRRDKQRQRKDNMKN